LRSIANGLKLDIHWEVGNVQTSVLLKQGLDGAKAGDFSMAVIMKVLTDTALAGDTYRVR